MGATIGESFSPQRNSLNLLRLVLATTVVVSHTIFLGGYASDVIWGKTTLGTLAVYGFFGISGYLIAGSASRNHVGRYLWQRVLRIFPGFWVCLVVTAFAFGLIGWLHSGASCGLSCYLRAPSGPLGYISHNSWLKINQPSIAHTLRGAPAPQSWNGSLWTLFYEFLCYLLLAALALLGMLRRRWTVLVLAIVAWLAQFVVTVVPSLNARFDVLTNWQAGRMLIFVPVFLTGSLLFLYQDRVPDSRGVALGCAGLVAISVLVPLGTGLPDTHSRAPTS